MIMRNHLRSILHMYMIFNTDFDGSFEGIGIFEDIEQLFNQLGNRHIIFIKSKFFDNFKNTIIDQQELVNFLWFRHQRSPFQLIFQERKLFSSVCAFHSAFVNVVSKKSGFQ